MIFYFNSHLRVLLLEFVLYNLVYLSTCCFTHYYKSHMGVTFRCPHTICMLVMFLHSCYSYKYKITHADTHKQGFFPPLFVPGRDSSCVEPSSEVLSLGSRGPADAAAALFLSLSLSLSLPQSVYVCLWLVASTAALLLFTPALTLTFIECRS